MSLNGLSFTSARSAMGIQEYIVSQGKQDWERCKMKGKMGAEEIKGRASERTLLSKDAFSSTAVIYLVVKQSGELNLFPWIRGTNEYYPW